jgi:hypothetical protein
LSSAGQVSEDTSFPASEDRQGHLVDRPAGPSSLSALCHEFCDLAFSAQRPSSLRSTKDQIQQGETEDHPAQNEAIKDVLTRMCFDAGIEDSFNLQSDHVPIRLPPKQFLLTIQTQYFQQADYTTDIFVQSCFWSNVERIYSRPFTPADEPWAICLNTIILLVLGSESTAEGNDPLAGSQFAQPFLLTIRTALSNPRVLMAPKLVNIQALALLVSTQSWLWIHDVQFVAMISNCPQRALLPSPTIPQNSPSQSLPKPVFLLGRWVFIKSPRHLLA